MSTPIIHASNLDIGYPGRIVGRQLHVCLRAGDIVCLLGQNGAGKSTLFKTLLGLLPPMGGDVRIQSRPLRDWLPRDLAHQIAYVPQAQDSPLTLPARHIVLLGRSAHLPLFGTPGKADHELAQGCLDRLGIGHLAERRYDQLSGGERQLVLIARALAQTPAALVMDEPASSLDFGNQIRLLAHMRRLADAGMGILFCTHQPDHARRVADTVLLFKNGAIQFEAPPASALTPARIAWLYDLDLTELDGPNAVSYSP